MVTSTVENQGTVDQSPDEGGVPTENNNDFSVFLPLCLTSLVNALIMVSFFPYAGWMVVWLRPQLTEETAGPSAGVLAGAFMVGRLLSAPFWGFLADKWGRKAVLQCSLIVSGFLSVLFGAATSYPLAVATRLGLGLANALNGTTKTMASEVLPGKEKQVMGWVVGMRSWGLLVGPALGGYLAEPLNQWKGSIPSWLAGSPLMYGLTETFPFVLPNLVIGILCFFCSLLVTYHLPETLEQSQSLSKLISRAFYDWREKHKPALITETTLLLPHHKPLPHDNEMDTSLQTATSSQGDAVAERKTGDPVWSRPNTRQTLKVDWFFSFGVTVLDEAFPLFAITPLMGWEEATIGNVLSLAGLLFALLQYPVYITVVNRLGIYRTIELGCLLGLLPAAGIPVLLRCFPATTDELGRHFPFLYLLPWSLLLAISKIFACTCLTCVALAINKSVPTSLRAQTNAYVVVGSSAVKSLAPIAGGYLVAGALQTSQPADLIFGAIALWGVGSAIYARTLPGLFPNNEE